MEENLKEQLKRTTEEFAEQEIEKWARFHFENKLLPQIIENVKSRLCVDVYQLDDSYNCHVDVTLKPETDKND